MYFTLCKEDRFEITYLTRGLVTGQPTVDTSLVLFLRVFSTKDSMSPLISFCSLECPFLRIPRFEIGAFGGKNFRLGYPMMS